MFSKKLILAGFALAITAALPAAKLVEGAGQSSLKTAWGNGALADSGNPGTVRLVSKNADGPAALNAFNRPMPAGSRCDFTFEARGDVKLQVMLNFSGDGKNKREDAVLPTPLTGEWRKFTGSFTVPEGFSRVTFDLLIWQQSGYAEIRNFQLMIPAQRGETMLLDEFFRQGAYSNNVFSKRIPAGWTEWRNGANAPELGGLSKDHSFAGKQFHSLRIPAIATGEAGWINRPTPLCSPARPMRLMLNWRVTDDFAANKPFARILFLDAAGKVLPGKALTFTLPVEHGDKWSARVTTVPAGEIPADAREFRVILGVAADGAPATGSVYFGLARILVPEADGTFARIRGGKLLNWYQFGEPVTFRALGVLPEGATAITGRIRGEDGRSFGAVTVAPDAMERGEWAFHPTEPGMYYVEFYAVTPKGEIRLDDEYLERVMNNQIGLFSPGAHSFAVVRDRESGTAPKLFGYQLSCSKERIQGLGDTEVKMAGHAGGSFARFHITWMQVEPEKGKFDWSALDYYVDKCIEAGIKPVICFYGTPRWASNTPDDERYVVHVWAYNAYAAKDINDWTNFISKMVNRYRDRVDTWEVWNEPHLRNYSCYWHDTPENFVALLKSAHETIKRIQPDSNIWLGGIALRYVPFYDRIIELGAGKYFDTFAIHGHGQQIAPFYAIDKKYNSPTHPWVNSEWHACLLRYSDPAYKLDETRRALRMMTDFFSMVRQGVRQIAFFEPFNLAEKETLKLHTDGGAPLNHSSGVFRRKPYFQPLLGAVIMANFSRNFTGEISIDGFYRFDGQKAILFRSDAGKLLAFWQEGARPEKVAPAIAGAIAKSKVESWEGRPVADPADFEMAPAVIYLATAPTVPADWKEDPNILRFEQPPQPLEHKVAGVYSTQPLFTADGKLIDGNLHWNAAGFALHKLETAPENFEKPTRFALALTGDKIQLVVETRDDVNHQPGDGGNMWQGDAIKFAFDPEAKGISADRIEFLAGKTPKGDELFKSANPTLVGDLPTAWTPPGMTVKTGTVKVQPLPAERLTRYLVEMPLSELYPLIPKRDQVLRFSLIANENDGKNRIGVTHWAKGIFNAKDPAEYGDLTPVK